LEAHRFVSNVWPDLKTRRGGKRLKERQESSQGTREERAATRYWDHWLTDGREPVFAAMCHRRSVDLLAGLNRAAAMELGGP
jgi:hypothetical protein